MLKDPAYWNNLVNTYKKIGPNATGSHNNITALRFNYGWDKEFKNTIATSFSTNGGNDLNEQGSLLKEYDASSQQDVYHFKHTGYASGFNTTGKILGFDRNPMIVPIQKYVNNNDKLTATPISGLSVTITNIAANGDMTVDIKFNDTYLNSSMRYTGNLVLKDNPATTRELSIKNGKVLTIDKSATPDRSTKGARGLFTDFINPSLFTIDKGAVEYVEDGGTMRITNGSTLQIKAGGKLIVQGSGQVIIENGGYLCVDDSASINLLLATSKIILQSGASIGSNPLLGDIGSDCLDLCAINSKIATSGSLGSLVNNVTGVGLPAALSDGKIVVLSKSLLPTLTQDLVIEKGSKLWVPEGSALYLPAGRTITIKDSAQHLAN